VNPSPDVSSDLETESSPRSRSDLTRERILAAAAATLGARGYSESRLADIAKAAELRPPAVYYYFDSRDDLIAEVMRVGQVLVREHVENAIDLLAPSTSPIDRVTAAVEAHLRVQLELSDFAHAVTRNAGHVPPPVRETLQRESDAYHELWRTLLHDAETAGQLRADLDPTIARMLVIGALNWAAEWWADDRDLDALIASAQSMVRAALSP
jgi:TetR/AcrR family transcriptional regulator, cholesterol catabolism regulator